MGYAITLFAKKVSFYMSWLGVLHMIQSKVVEWAFGVYSLHPGIFVGSILTSIILRLGAE
jgi:hypothetical protein